MGNVAWPLMRIVGPILLGILALLSFAIASPARAQAAPSASTNRPVMSCEALLGTALANVPGAPTHVTTANVLTAANGKPAYCAVEGYVAPQVGILMWLPTETWNGKFLELGCGGYCGMFDFISLCEVPIRRGFACITTDMGHRGKEAEGVEWAYNNPQAVTDFAYRATHVTALAGKAIAERFYGRKPSKSYFHGCSCGGRQALTEAQRFPYDFDGIVVGAPAFSYVDVTMEFALRARDLYADGKPLFDPAAIRLLGDAVIAKCDGNDGLKDGQIGDPRQCRFDPRDIACKAGAKSNCLSPRQVTAAIAFYAEQRSSSGVTLGQHAMLPGSEVSMLGIADVPVMKRAFYEDFYKYMGLVPNPGPSWKFEQFDLDRDYQRLGMIRSLMDAENPDLSRFKAAGGKLIFYQGWGDGALSGLTPIAYYKSVERLMGGKEATQDFFRLFMVPDMDHCFGGKGAWTIDYLAALEKWVEQDAAPDVLIGAHYTDLAPPGTTFEGMTPKFTRPVYPYPLAAHYTGRGDPNRATSFKAVDTER